MIDMHACRSRRLHNNLILKIRKGTRSGAGGALGLGPGPGDIHQVVVVVDEDAPDLLDDGAIVALLLSDASTSQRDIEG
ncbi:MAG: hypothetical protein H6825_12065 [Planctomycetes bacterium]|nr:hypothetical protein [Planctomycetota bacterium]